MGEQEEKVAAEEIRKRCVEATWRKHEAAYVWLFSSGLNVFPFEIVVRFRFNKQGQNLGKRNQDTRIDVPLTFFSPTTKGRVLVQTEAEAPFTFFSPTKGPRSRALPPASYVFPLALPQTPTP